MAEANDFLQQKDLRDNATTMTVGHKNTNELGRVGKVLIKSQILPQGDLHAKTIYKQPKLNVYNVFELSTYYTKSSVHKQL